MLTKIFKPATLAAAVLMIGHAQADEASVKQAVEDFVGAPAVESVQLTQYADLYEIVLRSGEVVYTDQNVNFIIDGRIIDTETRRDVTQARITELSAIDFDELPFENAFKQVRGDGSRTFATFEDPNCGYCKRLGAELSKLDNVTIYTFLYPVLGEDSDRKSRNIWCADDPAQAWNDWLLNEERPADKDCDTQAVDENLALGREMRVQGTPTIFLSDGQRIGGYVPAEQLEQALDNVE